MYSHLSLMWYQMALVWDGLGKGVDWNSDWGRVWVCMIVFVSAAARSQSELASDWTDVQTLHQMEVVQTHTSVLQGLFQDRDTLIQFDLPEEEFCIQCVGT